VLYSRKLRRVNGKDEVELFSFDLQATIPEAKGLSARNLEWMKQRYSVYTVAANEQLLAAMEVPANASEQKLNQLDSEILRAETEPEWFRNLIPTAVNDDRLLKDVGRSQKT